MRYIEKPARDRLLHWVVAAIVCGELASATATNPSPGAWLERLFKINGGLMGDPMWELDHIPKAGGLGHFQAHADEEFSGILPEDDIYSVEEVFDMLIELFGVYSKDFPNGEVIVAQILSRIPEYRERLRS